MPGAMHIRAFDRVLPAFRPNLIATFSMDSLAAQLIVKGGETLMARRFMPILGQSNQRGTRVAAQQHPFPSGGLEVLSQIVMQ